MFQDHREAGEKQKEGYTFLLVIPQAFCWGWLGRSHSQLSHSGFHSQSNKGGAKKGTFLKGERQCAQRGHSGAVITLPAYYFLSKDGVIRLHAEAG